MRIMCVPSHSRQVFPCGLEQPAGSFRASEDALLLARFARTSPPLSRPQPLHRPLRFADLGSGCGIVACALLLGEDAPAFGLNGVGIEQDASLCAAAEANVRRLGLERHMEILQGDVSDKACLAKAGRGTFDLVLTNPPYRITGQGRPSPQALRQAALAASPECLNHFLAAAAALLRHHGTLVCVLAAQRLNDALQCLAPHKLGLRRLCCVHNTPQSPAKRILLEARKNATADPQVEAPWILRQVC